jgi:hypothetical protein
MAEMKTLPPALRKNPAHHFPGGRDFYIIFKPYTAKNTAKGNRANIIARADIPLGDESERGKVDRVICKLAEKLASK